MEVVEEETPEGYSAPLPFLKNFFFVLIFLDMDVTYGMFYFSDASCQVSDFLDVVEEETPEGYSVPLPSPQIFFLQTE